MGPDAGTARSIELVAHRHANRCDLVAAVPAGADLVECDLHLRRGRTEVRHAKVLWPTGRLWERWYLLPRSTAVPAFEDVLAAAPTGTRLWIDLKGPSWRLASRVRVALDARGDRATVSTKSWWLLRRFRGAAGVRTMRSAGNRFELLLLRLLPVPSGTTGCVLHHRLVDREVLDDLRGSYGVVFCWGVTDDDRADTLVALGVDGLILDDLDLIARLAARRAR